VSTFQDGAGRVAQRRRTRRAIVDAASELIAAGGTPSVNEIAAAADVSRRTVYSYFPTLDQLLLDATLGALNTGIDELLDATGDEDPRARVEAMIRAVGAASAESLPLGRKLIRLTVDAPADPGATPRRGYRRVEWIEKAVGPLRRRLGARRFEDLVSALAMVIGWEALIVLQDLRGLGADATRVSGWAARALIDAALAEADQRE
jgi:AcrR family transcriptional regulator